MHFPELVRWFSSGCGTQTGLCLYYPLAKQTGDWDPNEFSPKPNGPKFSNHNGSGPARLISSTIIYNERKIWVYEATSGSCNWL